MKKKKPIPPTDHVRMAATLDLISEGFSYRETAKKLKMAVSNITSWMTRSAQGDPKTILAWREFGEQQFEFHRRSAFAMGLAHAESEIASIVSQNYWEEEVTFQGQKQYALDPRLIGLTDDEADIMYGTHDRFLRNKETGEAIPLKIRRKPSDAMMKLMLAAHMRSTYGDKSEVNVNVTGGLKILPRKGDKVEPKVIEQQPQEFSADVPQITHDEGQPTISLGRPARTTEEMDQWQADGDLTPHPVEFETADGKVEVINPVTAPAAVNQKLEILPTDSDLVRTFKGEYNKKLDAIAAGNVTPPQAAPVLRDHPLDPADKAEPKPEPQFVVTEENWKEHPRYIEALQRRANGQPENAIDKQLLDNGNWRAYLQQRRSGQDQIGAGTVRPGGVKVNGLNGPQRPRRTTI